MKRDHTALLKAGNAAQIEKLEMNGHKRGFDELDINYASKRIRDEMNELSDSIFWFNNGMGNLENVRHEAADIANFAHMIILACDKELKPS